MGRCSLNSPKPPLRLCTLMTSSLALEAHRPAAPTLTRSFHQTETPPEKCPGERRDRHVHCFSLLPLSSSSVATSLHAHVCLPGHKATATLSPLVRYIAAAVRSDPLEEPAETGARGTDRPVVRLRTRTRTAGAAPRSYTLSVTPERPIKKAAGGPGPSTWSSPPPCG